MLRKTILLAAAATATFASAIITQGQTAYADLRGKLARFDVVRLTPGETNISLPAAGTRLDVKLEPYDMRSAKYRAQDTTSLGIVDMPQAAVNTFRGVVAGEAGTEIRLNRIESGWEGIIKRAGEVFFVEPASRYAANAFAGEHIVYKQEDITDPRSFRCGNDIGSKIDQGRELAAGSAAEVMPSLRTIDIATDADMEYVNILGGPAAANQEILGIFNIVESLYASELGFRFRINYQHTWSGQSDPYSGSYPEAATRSFQSYWNSSAPFSGVDRDVAHLFSGKPGIQSQGWAFIAVVCRRPADSYGTSGYISWAPGKYLLTAHEVAHNMGAEHADAAPGCSNTLMLTQLSGATPLTFCQYSRDQVSNHTTTWGSCLSANSACAFDFDGDRRADIGVYRPSTGVWYLARSTAGFYGMQFGQPGDKPIAADYDGDGRADLAVYRNGVWFRFLSTSNTFDGIGFGLPTDIPAPADMDGDGKADVIVFRPSDGRWYMSLSANGAFNVVQFGQSGDVPMPGDFDGDGKADISVFRSGTGVWYRIYSSTGQFYGVQFGMAGDKPVMGDFDGDGRADTAVYRPSAGTWFVLRGNTNIDAIGFGNSTDVPAPADFDGDGKTDYAVFRPSTGIWYRLDSSNGFNAYPFGLSEDKPVQSYYLP